MGGPLFFVGDGHKSEHLCGHLGHGFAKLQSAVRGHHNGALRALQTPASARSGQKFKRLHRCTGVYSAPDYFTNAVRIGAQFLNDIGIRRALLSQDDGRDGLIKIQLSALNCDFVQFNTRYRVPYSCHGGYLLVAMKTEGRFQVPKVVVGRILQRCGNTGRVGDSHSLARHHNSGVIGNNPSTKFYSICHQIAIDTRNAVSGHRVKTPVFERRAGSVVSS